MTTVAHERPLLTIREVASRLSVSESTVRRLIEGDEFPSLQLGRPGGAVRIDEAEFDAWLNGARNPPLRPTMPRRGGHAVIGAELALRRSASLSADGACPRYTSAPDNNRLAGVLESRMGLVA